MRRYQKVRVLIQSCIAALLMQSAQAEDLFTVYQHAKESDPQISAAEAGYLATLEKGPQALADSRAKLTLSGSASYRGARNWSETSNNNTSTVSGSYSLNLSKPLYRPQMQKRMLLAVKTNRSLLILKQVAQRLPMLKNPKLEMLRLKPMLWWLIKILS